MGKNNRKRRAAKARARAARNGAAQHGAQRNRAPGNGARRRSPEDLEAIQHLIELAVMAHDRREPALVDRARVALAEHPPATVLQELERRLLMTLGTLWSEGWLPGELVHQVRRGASATASRCLGAAVAADHARRDEATLHRRWRSHLDKLDLAPSPLSAWLDAWIDREGTTRAEGIGYALDALSVLAGLGPVTVIIPPPGSPEVTESIIDARGASELSTDRLSPVMEKVRGLLAQAESTTFEAEAEAFTAKAQELMARHSIDAALLWGRSARQEDPTTIRIALDDPYVDAKSLLLQVVAEHSRCRAIFHPRYGMSAVVGFDVDLAATETMFTSLLIQAQAALQRASASAPAGSRSRSRSFRTSFFIAYANRIGDRLAEITSRVEAEMKAEVDTDPAANDGEAGRGLVPVLADRSSRVDAKLEELFDVITTNAVKGGRDYLGWTAGQEAADQAELGDESHLERPAPDRRPPAPVGGAQETLPLG